MRDRASAAPVPSPSPKLSALGYAVWLRAQSDACADLAADMMGRGPTDHPALEAAARRAGEAARLLGSAAEALTAAAASAAGALSAGAVDSGTGPG